jgi:hypothetical protein
MARIRGTFKRSRFELVPNPAYAGKTPTPLKAECHDGSPFITIQCDCGVQLHQHESSVVAVPVDAEIASRCPSCSSRASSRARSSSFAIKDGLPREL